MNRIYPLLLLVALATTLATGCKDDDMKTDAASVDELLARWAPKSEEFTGNTYTSARGLKVILAGPFISLATGQEVSGTPVSTITVYHDPIEMMMGGLQTVSYGEMLGTSGSFKLRTVINGEAVRARAMEMQFPALQAGLPMQLFTGSSDTGVFNWSMIISSDTLSPISNVNYYDTVSSNFPNGAYLGYVLANTTSWYPNGTISINCDYYPNTSLPLTGVQLSVAPLAGDVPVLSKITKLYFPAENTIMTGYGDPDGFNNVPIGHQAKAVAIVIDNEGYLFYGIIDLTIEPDGQYLIQLEPVSEDDLHAALLAL